jgi:hypothetical protein
MAPAGQSTDTTPQVTPKYAQPATPQAPPAQAQAPTPTTPAQQHASIFHNVLSMLGGGQNRPVRDAQGNPVTDANGQVQMHPASSKQLGMGILAGAISSMVAGMATPSKYNEVAPGRFQPDYSGAAAAGAQTAQKFTEQGTRTEAQQQADDQKTRQFATMDHNMKLHAALLSNLKMQGDLLDAGTDEDEPLIKGLTTAPPIQDPTDPTKTIDPIREQGVPEDKLQGMMKDGSVTRQSVLRDGKIQSTDADGKPIFNPDGTPHMQWTYTVYDRRAMVAMTNEMKGLSHKLDDVAPGTMVPISALAKYQQQNTELRGAQQSIDNKMKALGKDTINLKTAPDANLIRSIAPQIAKYGTDPTDLMFKDLRADKTVSGAALSALAKAMGVNDEDLEKMSAKRVSDLKQTEKGPDQQPADPTAVANFAKNAASRGLGVTPGQIATVQDTLGTHPTVKDMKDAYDKLLSVSAENQKAKAQDEGISEKQQKMLLDYGVAGNLRLNLDNAADEMLVDQRTGRPIPNKSLTALKASQTEVNRAQFATSVLHLADSLRKAQAAGTLPNGPLLGLTKEALGKAGLNDADAAKALTEISLLQSAATGAHVGGRFSVPVLDKMSGLLKLNMNDSQFLGSLDAITDTMQTYKDNGGRFSVAEWKALPQAERNRLMGQDVQAPTNRPAPPAGFHN